MAGCFVYFDDVDGEGWWLRNLHCVSRHGVAERVFWRSHSKENEGSYELEVWREWPWLHSSMRVSFRYLISGDQ